MQLYQKTDSDGLLHRDAFRRRRKIMYRKMETKKENPKLGNIWKLYIDGASSSDGSGAGLMLINPEGKEYMYALCFGFETTNNKAEYKELLAGLLIAQEMEIRSLAIFADSQLMVNQIKGLFEARQPATKQYLERVKEILKGTSQTGNIIKEIHEGSCGFNTKPHSMVVKVIKQGYYWPSTHRDVEKIIQDCTRCQEYSTARKVSSNDAIIVGSTWPFNHWEINILGPLPMAPGNLKFLAMAVEHSTKWVEAKPLTTMNGRQAEKFTWEHVVCRFGVPKTISSKDVKQYKEGIFTDFCNGLKIMQSFSPITEHVEIMNHIEKQLVQSQQGWADDLARVLWVHRTLPRNSQNETSFALTYGSEAIIPSAVSFIPESEEHTIKAKRKEVEEREETLSYSRYTIRWSTVWQGPHIISGVYEGELYKIADASDYSLV
ncbi:reverse transcriptase domain-containing protein [Tanacetum coccineum]